MLIYEVTAPVWFVACTVVQAPGVLLPSCPYASALCKQCLSQLRLDLHNPDSDAQSPYYYGSADEVSWDGSDLPVGVSRSRPAQAAAQAITLPCMRACTWVSVAPLFPVQQAPSDAVSMARPLHHITRQVIGAMQKVLKHYQDASGALQYPGGMDMDM